MTAPVKVVSARTPELVEAQIQRAEESGWELAWPVQGARSVTPDGAWDMTLFTATLRFSGLADRARDGASARPGKQPTTGFPQ